MRHPSEPRLMAQYNVWMNTRLYDAAATLPAEALAADRRAFFGSLLGTLNHIAVGDTIWLARIAAGRPADSGLAEVRTLDVPASLNVMLYPSLAALRGYRERIDRICVEWTGSLTEADLASALQYSNMSGQAKTVRLSDVLMHFFNHQTHHRGQATTLLSQAGVDMGSTDLIAIVPML